MGRDDERPGAAARERCEERFDVRDCAAAYLGVFQSDAYGESEYLPRSWRSTVTRVFGADLDR
jgi:hypothetical protein